MHKAEWMDVWHMIVAIVARQPPFLAILIVIGAVFVAVMALEGLRTSLLAIWRAHRIAAAPAPRPTENPVALAAVPATKSFSAARGTRAAATPARKRKPLTVPSRNFRSPRPTIRRHPMLEFTAEAALPHYAADTAVFQHEGV